MERHYVISKGRASISATVTAETIGNLIGDLYAIALLLNAPVPPDAPQVSQTRADPGSPPVPVNEAVATDTPA